MTIGGNFAKYSGALTRKMKDWKKLYRAALQGNFLKSHFITLL